ncbi:hypothetical protein Tcan_16504 [Toxocara canis]|uniref:Uncharacterized protein n=1 Tax=Toxocara canis TaxID=6265 RepID=A0A0B2VT02_TOXCA|nr:hypothetical protein Tcan_16504 [Toxocara canis]
MCQILERIITQEDFVPVREEIEFLLWVIFSLMCTLIELRVKSLVAALIAFIFDISLKSFDSNKTIDTIRNN